MRVLSILCVARKTCGTQPRARPRPRPRSQDEPATAATVRLSEKQPQLKLKANKKATQTETGKLYKASGKASRDCRDLGTLASTGKQGPRNLVRSLDTASTRHWKRLGPRQHILVLFLDTAAAISTCLKCTIPRPLLRQPLPPWHSWCI